MTPELAVEILRKAVTTLILGASPMLLVGLLVGLIVSIFQAATQVNEQTLTFVPKILSVFVTLLIFGTWLIELLTRFIKGLFEIMPTL